MATYGVDYYGRAFYGNVSLADFDATPFSASSIGYGKIFLTWATPTGDWSGLRLVRNAYGFPQTADDGQVLVDGLYGVTANSFYDPSPYGFDGMLPQGQYFYYSIFVKQTNVGVWVRAGNAAGLSVKDYGTSSMMYGYLPAIYKMPSLNSAVDNAENSQLRAFISIFGFYYDLFRTETSSITSRYNIQNVAGNLIPALMQQFGLEFEPELGIKRGRALLSNIIHINQSKGSRTGIVDYIKAFTGNSATVATGKNLMLDINDSSFEQSIGGWTATNATLAQHVPATITTWSVRGTTLTVIVNSASYLSVGNSVLIYGGTAIDGAYTIATLSGTTITATIGSGFDGLTGTGGRISRHAPYYEASNPYGVANARNATLKVTPTSTTAIVASCVPSSSSPILHGIPVTAGFSYTLSLRVWSETNTRTVQAQISWYDRTGTIIGSPSTSSGTTSSLTGWTLVSKSDNAPAGAVYAVPQFKIASPTTSEAHYFDAVQFEAGSSATYFQESRQLQVVVAADRVNELINPNFEASTAAPWTVTGATLNVQVDEFTPSPSSNVPVSSGAGEMYATGTTAATLTSATTTADYMPILAGDSYTFSGYVKVSADGSPTVLEQYTVQIDWYDNTNTLINSSYSGYFSAPLDQYARFSLTAASPTSAATAVVKLVWPAPTASGIGLLIDSFMFERAPFAADYFDGNNGYADLGDVVWEGTANGSRSHYYRNRNATETRLIATLPNYLTLGTNFAIYYAQP